FGDAAARLHGVGGEAVDHHAVLDDVSRGCEHPGDPRRIAGGVGEGLVVRAALPHRDGAGPDRILGGGDGGQRVVLDLDRLGGVLGLLPRFGGDEGGGGA